MAERLKYRKGIESDALKLYRIRCIFRGIENSDKGLTRKLKIEFRKLGARGYDGKAVSVSICRNYSEMVSLEAALKHMSPRQILQIANVDIPVKEFEGYLTRRGIDVPRSDYIQKGYYDRLLLKKIMK